jgi:rfaE bifunctional protein nucleotidyltransferase chain/domain/rfaE bifunctional protein kinase chain/domain
MSAITIVGDALLDCDVIGTAERLSPDAPVPVVDELHRQVRAGGAALAASLAAGAGHHVRLVAPIGGEDDAAGSQLRALLAAAGVELIELPSTGRTAEKTRVRVDGHSIVRLDRGGIRPSGPVPEQVAEALADADAVLVADYGGGTTGLDGLRRLLRRSPASRPLVWDPHPKGSPAVPGATLLTPNEREAEQLAPRLGKDHGEDRIARAVRAANLLCHHWRSGAVCVTLGARGALLCSGPGSPLVVPAVASTGGDPCGAGDCFAVSATAALAAGALASEAVVAAVRAASAYVAAGPAPGPAGSTPAGGPGTATASGPLERASRVRADGGTVVVAGGCFDLLHRGHVELLGAARQLGDCLIVALNSDVSVRQLKGPGRPVMPASERATILRALAAVDDVMVFDEPSPAAALRALRPHLFVKGGDYAGMEIEEQSVLAQWGGQVVTVPYLPEHSTTRIVAEVRRG